MDKLILFLKEGAKVLRYAPSPTGFQHIGGVFASLINERLAHQSGGIFYLRIEDTDQKREVEGAIDDTIKTMHNFGMDFDEGITGAYLNTLKTQKRELMHHINKVKELIYTELLLKIF